MAEAFNQAVSALLQNSDPASRQRANHWLEEWQQTPEAWTVATGVLQHGSGIDAQYFAAQTLRTKVQRDFEELPLSAVHSLQETLVQLTLQHARSSPAIRTQLCLALAALALHLPPTEWADGAAGNGSGHAGVVYWLWARFGGQAPDIALPCMLELLTVLPEEASTYQPSVRPERRHRIEQELSSTSAAAFQILTAALQQSGPNVKMSVCRAFASWLRLTVEPFPAEAAQHLVQMVLQALSSKDTFDSAVDAIVEVIYRTAMWQERKQLSPEWGTMVQAILQVVMGLRQRFMQAAQLVKDDNEGRESEGNTFGDDLESAKGMARLFAEAGEAHAPAIVAGWQEGLGLVQAMLEVAAFPEDSICAISFNFWHRLSRLLTSDPPGAANGALVDAALPPPPIPQHFLQAFEQLVNVVRGRVRYPDDFESWHRDDQDEFKRSRFAIGDTLLDAAVVLKGQRTIGLLSEPLQQEMLRLAADGGIDWRNAEAALFCIRAVYRCAPDAGDAGMAALLASWLQLPPQPVLQHTLAMTLAVYADWLAASLRLNVGAELPPLLLQLLGQALSHRTSASAAATAIRHLCDACARQLAPHWDLVAAMYDGVQVAGGAAPPPANGAAASPLLEEDVHNVMEAVVLVLNVIPAEQQPAALQRMFSPLVQPLHQLLASQPQPQSADQREAILTLMDRLGVLFRHVQQPAAIVEVFAGVWPMFQAALGLYGREPRPSERLCKAIRYALRGGGQSMAAQAQPLLTALPEHFASSRQSCYLYAASELVKTFGSNLAYEQALGSMLSRMLGEACAGLRTLAQFNEDPELADDTFLLVGRMLAYSPRLVLAPGPLSTLLDTALAGVLVQHRDACGSVMTFLVRLLEMELPGSGSSGDRAVYTALLPRAPAMVRLLLAGAAGALPPARNPQIAGVLFALIKVTQQQGLQWASQAVAAVPETALSASDRQKLLGVMQVTAIEGPEARNYGEFEDVIEDLSDSCRRHRRFQDAAQQALLPPPVHA